MIKLIVFDLDGVLVDAREIHYESLNKALEQAGYDVIPRDEHLSTYDGLSTYKKLELLKIPKQTQDYIWGLKQHSTMQIIDSFTVDERLQDILKKLKGKLLRLIRQSRQTTDQ